VTKTIMVHVLP